MFVQKVLLRTLDSNYHLGRSQDIFQNNQPYANCDTEALSVIRYSIVLPITHKKNGRYILREAVSAKYYYYCYSFLQAVCSDFSKGNI